MANYAWNIVSKNIKRELKKAYPKCNFSVRIRKSTYTYGVTVSWTDGVTKDLVKEITNKYTNDSKGDFHTVVNGLEQVRFIDLDREISEEVQKSILSEMEKTEQDLPTKENNWNNDTYYEMLRIFNSRNYGEYIGLNKADNVENLEEKAINDLIKVIRAKILNTVEVCGFKYNIVDIGNGQTEWVQVPLEDIL